MMSRKYLYPLLIVLFTVCFLVVEEYVHKALDQPVVEAGSELKETTNAYFLPTSTTGAIIHHHYYSLSYSEAHEQAEWVAYELKKDQVVNADYKRPYFEVDPAVETKSAHWKNYKKSGYDRGHLCPAGDREFSRAAYEETFLTSNISPQLHTFNAGIWNRLEQQVRSWALKYDGVYVITGGIFTNPLGAIGDEKVTVPSSFFKIVYDQSGNRPKVVTFLIPHKEDSKPLQSMVTTVDAIEQITGIDFFSELPDAIEDKLEASIHLNDWKF